MAVACNETQHLITHTPYKWIGRILWTLSVPFMAMNIGFHLVQPPFAAEATRQLGFDPAIMLPLGLAEIVFLGLYLYPRTSIWGAVLFTGYLGGATAIHVLNKTPFLFPLIMAAMLWGALICLNPKAAEALGFSFTLKEKP